jgi:hypothetical protein
MPVYREKAHAAAPGSRLGLRQGDQHIRIPAQRDERLQPVQHPVIAIARGTRLHVLHIVAGLRLGHGNGHQTFTGNRAPCNLALRLGAVLIKQRARHVLHQHRHRQIGVDTRHLLHGNGFFIRTQACASNRLIGGQSNEASLGHRHIEVSWKRPLAIGLLPSGRHLTLRERPAHVAEGLAVH